MSLLYHALLIFSIVALNLAAIALVAGLVSRSLDTIERLGQIAQHLAMDYLQIRHALHQQQIDIDRQRLELDMAEQLPQLDRGRRS